MTTQQERPAFSEHMDEAHKSYQALQLADALQHYEAALSLQRDSYDASLGQARTLARMRRQEQAYLAAERCVEIDAQRPEAYVTLGALHFLTDRLDEAMGMLEKAIALAPNDPEAYLTLSQVYADKKEMDEAWAWHEKAQALIAALPDEMAQQQMGALSLHVATYLQLSSGHDAEAMELAQQVIAYEEANPYAACLAYSNLGIMQARARHYDEAIEYLERAYELNPYFYRAGGALGRILIVRGKHDRAAEVLGDIVALNPDGEASTRYAYAAALAKTGRREEALAQYQQALARGLSGTDTLIARWQVVWLSTAGRYVVIALALVALLLWVVVGRPSPQVLTFVGLLVLIVVLQRTVGRRRR